MEIDIFNRENLIGDQKTSTINNFDDYLDSLLNPFNNLITIELLKLDDLDKSIEKPIILNNNLVNQLQINDNKLQQKLIYINNLSTLLNDSDTYITELNTTKTTFTNILNSKALPTSSLVRPKLRTVIDSNKSALNIAYIKNKIISYTLPMPVPNTKLYVNRNGNGFVWL